MAFVSSRISVVSSSLNENSGWIYLVDWILSLILGIAFIFYFNRLVGFVFSHLFNLVLQKRYGIKIHMQAFKISPLGGRIFAKNLTIITKDYTISIIRLNLTWRYWLFKLTRVSEYYEHENDHNEETNHSRKYVNSKLPFRLLLHLDGLEIFMYNRTAAYDSILEALNLNESNIRKPDAFSEKAEPKETNLRYRNVRKSSEEDTIDDTSGETPPEKEAHPTQLPWAIPPDVPVRPKPPWFLKLLPLQIRIRKGAVVVGNVCTPSILVMSYTSANGAIDITRAPDPGDNYRFWQDINFEAFQIWMKPNIKYNHNKYKDTTNTTQAAESNISHLRRYKQFFMFQRAVGIVRKKFHSRIRHKLRTNLDEAIVEWRGLRRYIGTEEDANLSAIVSHEEQYAKFTLILDSTTTRVVYYFDNPGLVVPGNETCPGHGVELELSGATIHYGPWADKQRVPLQNIFFPSLARDSRPTPLPEPNTPRQFNGFLSTVLVKDELIFRIPTREKSKDIRLSRSNKMTRPFGWLELKMGSGSTLSSFTSYVADAVHGWDNRVDLLFISPEIRTSVNHDILFMADTHEMAAKVGFPLEWNGKCSWQFDLVSENARVFFLREHTLLFSDIFSDFSTGSPTPYEEFRPFVYNVNWNIHHYKIYLNVNDANIINNPLDFNVNKYLSFQGDDLAVDLELPLYGEFAKSTTVSYAMNTSFFDLVLDTPPWHTASAFMKDSSVVGRSNNFSVEGNYTFFSNIEVYTSDYIEIRCVGDDVTLKFHGFLIKYLFIIKENYFGDNIHFKTFEEYNNLHGAEASAEASSVSEKSTSSFSTSPSSMSPEVDYWHIIKVENDIDLLFSFQVRRGLIVLPLSLYDCKSHVGLMFDSLDVDIRFTNYYMDLQADLSPITSSFVPAQESNLADDELEVVFDLPKYRQLYSSDTSVMSIDGLSIHAHRMFGIPPEEITFFCKWDFEAGHISIDSEVALITSLATFINNFTLGFKDIENSLNLPEPVVYDALNFSFRCEDITVKLSVKNTPKYLLANINSVLFSFNDIANERYSTRASASIPHIQVSVEEKGYVHGCLKTSLNFTNICQKKHMLEHRKLQQANIKTSDAPFHRAPFLLFPENRDSNYNGGYGSFLTQLSLPNVNHPLTSESWDSSDESLVESPESSISTKISKDSFDPLDSPISSKKKPKNDLLDEPEDQFYTEKFAPKHDYDPEEFCPTYEVKPEFEYDNLIFELGAVHSYLTPNGLVTFAQLVNESNSFTLDKLMDELEVKVVKCVAFNKVAHFAVANIRLVTSEINLKFGSFITQDPQEIFDKRQNIPFVSVNLIEPSIAASIKNEKEERTKFCDIQTDITVAGHLKDLFVSVSNPENYKSPVLLNIRDIEAWAQIPSDESSQSTVASCTVDAIELDMRQNQFQWLLDYILRLKTQLQPAMVEFAKPKVPLPEAIAQLVYKLSKASIDYSIDNDPEVLTKPANTLRSIISDHVRLSDGWKIMSRLRHVLNSLPKEWYKTAHEALQSSVDWRLPPTAIEEITEIFSHWRSWEANPVQRDFFFRFVLSPSKLKHTEPKPFDLQVNVPDVLLNISDEENEVDFISLENLSCLSQISTQKLQDRTSVGLGIIEVVKAVSVVLNLGSYKSHVSDLSLGMIMEGMRFADQFKTNQPEKAEEKADREKNRDPLTNDSKVSDPSYQASFMVNVDSLEQYTQLPSNKVALKCKNVTSAVELSTFTGDYKDIVLFSSVQRINSFEISILNANKSVLSKFSLLKCGIVVTNAGGIVNGSKISEITVEKMILRIYDKNEALIKGIEGLMEKDIPYLKSIAESTGGTEKKEQKEEENLTKESDSPQKSGNASYQKVGDFALNISLGEFNWIIEILEPIRISGVIFNNKLSIERLGGTVLVDSYIRKVDINGGIGKTEIIELENSDIVTGLKYNLVEDMNLLSVSLSTGYTKLFSPSLVDNLKLVIQNQANLKNRIDVLQKILNVDDSPNTSNSPKSSKSGCTILDKLAFKSKLTNDYIGISTFANKTKYSFEIENTSLGVYNVASSSTNESASDHRVVPIYGNFEILTARLSVLDRTIAVGISNILDFSICIRLLNNISGNNSDLHSLQVESQHFRMCLSTPALVRILVLIDHIKDCCPQKKKTPKAAPVSEVEAEPASSFSFLNKFSSVHFLAYNFCFGWVFENGDKNYPGVILGAERFFAITEEKLGKLTLMEGYLSVANGARSTNFYSTTFEKNSLNRAFLPKMQLVYTIDQSEEIKSMKIVITGDELDVKFLSNSIVLVEYGAKSGSDMQKFFKARDKKRGDIEQVQEVQEVQEVEEVENNVMNGIKSAFQSIEVVATYAGANVLINRLSDDTSEPPPSLYLHSPAVKMAVKYRYDKSAPKKHIIRGETLTTSSENTLYPYCIPVVNDIIDGAKKMMHSPPNNDEPVAKRGDSKPPGGKDFASLLSDIDIYFGVKIEKQALTLSCAPTVKVAAMVGIKEIYIQLNTGTSKEDSTLVLTVLFDSVSASLQHVYSREISGSTSIKKVTITNAVEFGDVAKILSSGSVVDVDGYVNVKQFQDVELFKDVWFPESYSDESSPDPGSPSCSYDDNVKTDLAANKNISSRFKEVSTTYAIPWVLTLIVSNINLQVDFGKSLGNFKLNLDKAWAVSKKSTDWAQDLKMGVDSICLQSEGRLGGSFDVKNVKIHTAISWKLESGVILDVPLILISGAIDKLMLKTSFDYHVFAIANIEGLSIDIFNRKSEVSLSKDHLFVSTKMDAAEVYITSLSASNCLDIYNTVARMIQENKRSYKETLRESARGKSVAKKTKIEEKANAHILETVKKLEAKIQVVVGKFSIHIYPSSFDDSKVLVIKLDESRANFQQNEYAKGISNNLEIEFTDLKVSLSMTSPVSEDFVAQCKVEEFVQYARKARGGTIFVFPSFKISMRTFQKYNDNIIKYLYQSSFGGTVDIKWNLGSVNFIREMYSIHAKALRSRIEYRNTILAPPDTGTVKLRDVNFSQGPSKHLKEQLDGKDPTEQIDEAINKTLNKVTDESKYKYTAIAPAIIEAPRLKELGNATPPLEWFGLYREKFPHATHQFGIVSLQKMMHEVESQYSKILGRA